MTEPALELHPIGVIRRVDGGTRIEIREGIRPALKQLDHFSHVLVFWWADRHDNSESRTTLTCEPPYARGHLTGVFACRAEYRPNPLAMTVCRILSADETSGVLVVADIDAYDGTPVLDLKAYFPVCDRVRDARIPEWLSGWPEWLPEEGIGL